MKKLFLTSMLLMAIAMGCDAQGQTSNDTTAPTTTGEPSTVYFTSRITPESLVEIYNALGVKLEGKVAVKISTGEKGGHNFLQPTLIADLVKAVDGTIVECNTAYGGSRGTTDAHLQTIKDHGFTDIAEVDIMDSEGEMQIEVKDKKHLQYDIVGSHLPRYNSMINLAHFKGHAMGGFGGVLKNQSIGVASSSGKLYIHTAGASTTQWRSAEQDDFLESMAAAAQAVHDYFGEGKIVYINVMNNLSVDCDCDASPEDPKMNDVGILASTDPVALDKACLDLVFNYNSTEGDDAAPLIARINRQHGTHIVDYAEQIGLGTRSYKLVDIDASASVDNAKAEEGEQRYNVFSLDGKKLLSNAASLESLPQGTYVVNGVKTVID